MTEGERELDFFFLSQENNNVNKILCKRFKTTESDSIIYKTLVTASVVKLINVGLENGSGY